MIHRTLLFWTTGIVLFSAVVFAAPLIVTAIVLGITMLVSPAVWVVGSSYAANGQQAFFRGGLIAGVLPFVSASGVALTLGMPGVFSPTLYTVAPSRNVGVGVVPAASTAPGELAAPNSPSTSMPDAPMLNSAMLEDPPVVTAPAPVVTTAVAIEYRSPYSPVVPQSYAETLPMRLTMAILWLSPGVFAFLGGGLSYLTFRWVASAQTQLFAHALAGNASFTTCERHTSGSTWPEQNLERVASERG